MTDLDLVLTEELLDELQGRFDHGVVTLLRESSPQNFDVHTTTWGCPLTCCGLAEQAKLDSLAELQATDFELVRRGHGKAEVFERAAFDRDPGDR